MLQTLLTENVCALRDIVRLLAAVYRHVAFVANQRVHVRSVMSKKGEKWENELQLSEGIIGIILILSSSL